MFTFPVGLGAFLPISLPGCRCWLRSDLGITLVSGNVSNWANQVAGVSGDASQSSAGARPTYVANSQNGRPGLGFTGPTTSGMQWALDLQGAKTVAVVAKMSATPGAGTSYTVLSIKGSTGPVTSELYTVNAGGFQNVTFKDDLSALAASVGFNPTLDTNAHSYIHTYNGGTNTSTGSYTGLYDAAGQTINTGGNVGGRAGTDLCSIGAFITSGGVISNGFSGGMYEIVVYNRVLSASELGLLALYFKGLYAL